MLWVAQVEESEVSRVSTRNFWNLLFHDVPVVEISLLKKLMLLICRYLLNYFLIISRVISRHLILDWLKSIWEVVKYDRLIFFLVRSLCKFSIWRNIFRLSLSNVQQAIIVDRRKYLTVFVIRISTLLILGHTLLLFKNFIKFIKKFLLLSWCHYVTLAHGWG